MSSGAIQLGVPTILFLIDTSYVSWAQKPKSPTLMLPSVSNKILSLFKSLWILCYECKYNNPDKIDLAT